MAADLHIHVLEGATEEDIVEFFRNTMGSKHFDLFFFTRNTPSRSEGCFHRIAATPNVWIGEVSWLKAVVFEDGEMFIPSTVQLVHDIVGEELLEVTEEMIQKIVEAFDAPNATSYRLAEREKVADFLRNHIGKRVFTVSW